MNPQSKWELSGSVAIFLHWSKSDKISKNDQVLISALSTEFDNVIVTRNLNKVSFREPSLNHHEDNVFFLDRFNSGYDFGGYSDTVKALGKHRKNLSEILLTNNSIFLSTVSLKSTMIAIRDSSTNLTSLTDSYEYAHHLQSYFLHFDHLAIGTDNFWKWWEEIETYSDKESTVQNLEIQLARVMGDFGISSSAIYKYHSLVNFALSSTGMSLAMSNRNEPGFNHAIQKMLSGEPINPTHYLWFWLKELGYPFLKKDLLRDFGNRGVALERWQEGLDASVVSRIKHEISNPKLKK